MNITEKYGKWAVILGASEGVGQCLAEKLAGFGANVLLLGRRGELLNALAEKIEKTYGVETIVMVQDLEDPDSADKVFERTKGLDVGFMSYVACKSLFGRYERLPLEERMAELQTNVISLTRATYLYYDLFRKKGKGCILNISSASGVNGVPCLSGYAATKAYISQLCRTLAYESIDSGIDVGVAILGSTSTPGFIRSQPKGPAGEAAIKNAMTPEDTIDEIFRRWDELPCIVVGEKVRASVSPFVPNPPREQMAALMQMFDR